MTYRKLYFLWLIASAAAIIIGVLFYLSAMKMTYGNFSGHEDFDGLLYFIESIILIIFSTGIISALLVLTQNKLAHETFRKRLATRLLAFYSTFALFCVATFHFAFIYMNPLSLVVFAVIPKLAWDATVDQSKTKQKTRLFMGLLVAILLLGGLEFLNIVLSDPYRR